MNPIHGCSSDEHLAWHTMPQTKPICARFASQRTRLHLWLLYAKDWCGQFKDWAFETTKPEHQSRKTRRNPQLFQHDSVLRWWHQQIKYIKIFSLRQKKTGDTYPFHPFRTACYWYHFILFQYGWNQVHWFYDQWWYQQGLESEPWKAEGESFGCSARRNCHVGNEKGLEEIRNTIFA